MLLLLDCATRRHMDEAGALAGSMDRVHEAKGMGGVGTRFS